MAEERSAKISRASGGGGMPILQSELTCPHCGRRQTAEMPTSACVYFFECGGCGTLLKPKAGDCCVFCSYGDVPCPPVQSTGRSGRSSRECP
jgi:hypothetical protein